MPVESKYGRFEPGLVMGVRFRCRTTTQEGVTGTGLVDQRLFLPGDVEHMFWEADGTPRNRTRVERLDSAHATAGSLFNRIPDVIAARPGIVPVYELGPLKSTARLLAGPVVTRAPKLAWTAEQLIARAREITGIELADTEAVEPLGVLLRALNEESGIDAEGARAYEAKFLRLLCNRLRMQRDFARHPEIAEQEIAGPLVIMGVARSGTTKLQKVLAASGQFNFLTFWQNFNWASDTGVPGEDVAAAHRRGRCILPLVRSALARNQAGPPFRGARAGGRGTLERRLPGGAIVHRLCGDAELCAWLATRPRSIFFEFLRDVLKYQQWQGLAVPGRPWLLKSPNYNGFEPLIREIFPDARFVVAHRSPFETLASMCKLVRCFRQAYGSPETDDALIVEGNYRAMEAHLANRRDHPGLPFLDLRFEDIVGRLDETIARVYRHAGMVLTDRLARKHACLERGEPDAQAR